MEGYQRKIKKTSLKNHSKITTITIPQWITLNFRIETSRGKREMSSKDFRHPPNLKRKAILTSTSNLKPTATTSFPILRILFKLNQLQVLLQQTFLHLPLLQIFSTVEWLLLTSSSLRRRISFPHPITQLRRYKWTNQQLQ